MRGFNDLNPYQLNIRFGGHAVCQLDSGWESLAFCFALDEGRGFKVHTGVGQPTPLRGAVAAPLGRATDPPGHPPSHPQRRLSLLPPPCFARDRMRRAHRLAAWQFLPSHGSACTTRRRAAHRGATEPRPSPGRADAPPHSPRQPGPSAAQRRGDHPKRATDAVRSGTTVSHSSGTQTRVIHARSRSLAMDHARSSTGR